MGFHERQLLRSLVFRLFNLYGPRQGVNEYSGVITLFFDCCRQGSPLTIYGDDSQTRDFVHVYDVADAIVNALERDSAEGQVFNVGYGKPTSILELAQTVLKLTDRSLRIIYEESRRGDIGHSFADISKAQQVLGYKPNYALEDGLRTLVDEFSECAVD